MKLPANLRIEYETIGAVPLTVSLRNSRCPVVYREFDVPSAGTLPGATALSDVMSDLEADPTMTPHLRRARGALAEVLDHGREFRQLRLASGLSQSKLAEAANTSQAYVARIEAGTVDPGTDMLQRIARALRIEPAVVFSAVIKQRAKQGSSSVG
jgi:DNA-binding XRE family transcriptional regulator